jgi:hypothetical protein
MNVWGLGMPKQETYFEQAAGSGRVEVIKSYDVSYALEVFRAMDEPALRALAVALEIEANYDSADVPDPNGSEYEDFLWNELREAGIEDVRIDPNLRSFFIVSLNSNGKSEDLYVSADWPSAEAFAKLLIAR